MPSGLEYALQCDLASKGTNFTPGAEYVYCNTGFTLLAQIVRRVSGEVAARVHIEAHIPARSA